MPRMNVNAALILIVLTDEGRGNMLQSRTWHVCAVRRGLLPEPNACIVKMRREKLAMSQSLKSTPL